MILRPLSTSAGTAMSCPGSGDGCHPPASHIGRNTSVLPPASYTLTLDVDRKSDNAGFEGLPVDGERMH